MAPEPIPPLIVTTGLSANSALECAAQVEFQALDNNGRTIGAPELRLVVADGSQTEPTARLDDLSSAVEIMLRADRSGEVVDSLTRTMLELFDRETLRLAEAIKEERNRLREKRRQVRERTCPPWLGPLAQGLRAFWERLPEQQYSQFLTRWNLTDEALGKWLDAVAAGIDLDDPDLVEQLRKLQSTPAAVLDEFGAIKDAVQLEEDVGTGTVQLDFELEPVVHQVEARVTNIRINLPE